MQESSAQGGFRKRETPFSNVRSRYAGRRSRRILAERAFVAAVDKFGAPMPRECKLTDPKQLRTLIQDHPGGWVPQKPPIQADNSCSRRALGGVMAPFARRAIDVREGDGFLR
jgi:hypothetical protein